MKNFLCAVLCIVLLCSCSSERKVRVINEGVCYTAHIFYGENEFVAWCEAKDNCMEFVTEQGAEGLRITVNPEKAILRYEEKEIVLLNGEYDYAFYKLIYDVNKYFNGDYKVEERDDVYIVNGKVTEYDFELILSPTGFPIELKIEEIGFFVKYYDILVKKG